MDSRAYLLITLVLYAAGALHALLHAVLRRSALTTVSLIATLLGFAFHTAALAQRWSEAGHFPAVGLRDGASLLAWAIVLVLLLVHQTVAPRELYSMSASIAPRTAGPGPHGGLEPAGNTSGQP